MSSPETTSGQSDHLECAEAPIERSLIDESALLGESLRIWRLSVDDSLQRATEIAGRLTAADARTKRDVSDCISQLKANVELGVEVGQALETIAEMDIKTQAVAMADPAELVTGVYAGLVDTYDRLVTQHWEEAERSFERIFPSNVAEVCLPDTVVVSVEPVNRWQRRKNLSRDEADAAYLGLTAEARRAAIDAIGRQRVGNEDDYEVEEADIVDVIVSTGNDQLDAISTLIGEINSDLVDIAQAISDAKKIILIDMHSVSPQPLAADRLDRRKIKKYLTDINRKAKATRDMIDSFESSTVSAATASVAELYRADWASAVSEVRDDILRDQLDILSSWLDSYHARQVVDSPSRRDAKSGPAKDKPHPTGRGGEIQYIDRFTIGATTMPWLDSDAERAVEVQAMDNGIRVGFVNGLSDEARSIMSKSFSVDEGWSRRDEVSDDVLARRIQVALERSAAGLFDGLPRLLSRDSVTYPYEIRCPKIYAPDAPRVYFSHITKEQADDRLSAQLTAAGADSLLILVGASRKRYQIKLLQKLTGNGRAELRSHSVGS